MDLQARSPLGTLLVYTLVTYAISWSLWGLWAILPDGSALVGAGLLALGAMGPFFAGLILTRASGGSVRAWLRDIFRVRVPGRTYAIAVVFPLGVIAIAAGVHVVGFGGELTPDAVPRGIEYPLYLGFILLLGGGLEEPGWRGYLLPRLQRGYTGLTAALLIGVVWTVWHLPLFAIPGSIQSELTLWLYVPQVIALSVVFTWLTNDATGSVLPAMIIHAGANAALNYYPVGGVAGAIAPLGMSLLVATVVTIAVGLVVVSGRSLGSRRNPLPSAPVGR